MKLPAVLVKLGEVLDLKVEKDGKRRVLTWRRTYWLCADETERRLWLVPKPTTRGGKLNAARAGRELKAAMRVHERWSDFTPELLTPVRVRLGAERERGRGITIGYRSTKWTGKAEDYEHQFEGANKVRQLGSVYLISGGGVSVTPAGVRG